MTVIVGSSATTPSARWWVGVGVVLVTTGLNVVGLAWSPEIADQFAVAAWLVVTGVTAGVLVARVPGNAVGWLLAAVAVCVSLQGAAFGLANVLNRGVLFDVAAWLSHWVAVPGFGLFAFVVLLFPTGSLPSPRWRWLPWCLAVGLTAMCTAVAFAPAEVGGLEVTNPFAWESAAGILHVLATSANALLTMGVVATIASLVVRYRRSRGDERQQLKWFLFAVVVLVVTLLFAGAASGPVNELSFVLALIGLTAIPAAVGIAILEYQLYDIDQVINRALVYTALTVVVVALYVATVGVVTVVFDRALGLAASLAATAVAAVAFHPLRTRLQKVADRLVYGQRNEPVAAISTLARQLHRAPDPARVPEHIVSTVAAALKLPYVAVELAHGRDGHTLVEHGTRPELTERLPIDWQGEQLGGLVIGGDRRLRTSDRSLLADLARQAAPALDAVRLNRALERSRQQLVIAREEERRRLRGDLHDGLGPQLAGIAMGLDAVGNLLGSDPTAARETVNRLRTRSHHALETVRAVSRGLRPPILDDLGLVTAVREHADALGTPHHRINVTVDGDVADLPAAVEVAAYHICLEAMTNAARHARATATNVTLRRSNATLELAVSDDGRGLLNDRRNGIGLSSMRARAQELGGTLTLTCGETGGTTVRTVLPLRSP